MDTSDADISDEELAGLRARTNGLYYGSVGAAALAGGLGAVLALTW